MKKNTLLGVLAALAVLAVSGCTSPVSNPAGDQRAGGSLRIAVTTPAAKAILPAPLAPTDLVYNLTLTKAGQADITLGAVEADKLLVEGLTAGTWTLTITGIQKTGAGAAFAKTGPVAVIDGPNAITWSLDPLPSGAGSYDVTVTWPLPANASDRPVSAQAWLSDDPLNLKKESPVPLATSDFSSSTASLQVKGAKASGAWFLLVELSNGTTVVATPTDLIRIFPNRTSAGTLALAASEFNRAPGAPTDLKADLVAGKVRLTWTDSGATEEGYQIWRDGSKVGETGPSVCTFDDSPGDQAAHSYTVTAFNVFNASPAAALSWPGVGGVVVKLNFSNPNLPALAFVPAPPATAITVAAGSNLTVTTTDPTLGALTTGWKWYVDNVLVSGQTGPTLVWNTKTWNTTGASVGDHQVSAEVRNGSFLFSGGFKATVTDSTVPRYSVTYANLGAEEGSVPFDLKTYLPGETATVLGNTGTLKRWGSTFGGWVTALTGPAATYAIDPSTPTASCTATLTLGSADVTLYPIWIPNLLRFTGAGNKLELNGYASVPTAPFILDIPQGVTSMMPWPIPAGAPDPHLKSTFLTGISIPATVTWFGSYIFSGSPNVTRVTLAEGLKTLGGSLCIGMTKLTSISLPSTLTGIAAESFAASGLTSVTLPPLVTSLDAQSFRDTPLTSVSIPASVTSISDSAFDTVPLTSFTVDPGNSVYRMEGAALINQKTSTLVRMYPFVPAGPYTVPPGITALGNRAFVQISGVTSISLPASLTSIGSNVFVSCGSLASVTIDPANPSFQSPDGKAVFNKAGTSLVFALPTLAGAYTVPAGTTEIQSYAFNSCSGMTSVTLPNGLKTIGSMAFYGCAGLTSVLLPSSVTAVGSSSFYGCPSLLTVVVAAPTPPSIPDATYTFGQSSALKIFVPASSLAVYQAAAVWKDFAAAGKLQPIAAPRTGLAGEWLMDGSANDTSAAAGGPNNGTVNGPALAVGRKGATDTAYQFTGISTTNILLPSCPIPGGTTAPAAYSISLWVFSDRLYGPNGQNLFVNTAPTLQPGGAHCNVILRLGPDNKVRLGAWPNSRGSDLVSPAAIPTNTWTHIAAVKNGLFQAIYVNGVLAASDTNAQDYTGAAVTQGSFGQQLSDSNFNLFGRLDDVRIYNRALTAAEITLLSQE